MGFIRGLLTNLGGLEDDEGPRPPGALSVAPGQPQGLLSPVQPPQSAPMPMPAQNPAAHEHQGGLLGGLKHLVGTDRISPELGAMLTPDQRERVKPGLLGSAANLIFAGRTPTMVQDARAQRLLGLQEQKKGMNTTAAQEAQRAQFVKAFPFPSAQEIAADPERGTPRSVTQQWIDTATRASAMLPVADPDFAATTARAASSSRPPSEQRRAIRTMGTVNAPIPNEDGTGYHIKVLGADGEEVNRIPVNAPTQGVAYLKKQNPDGTVAYIAAPRELSVDDIKQLPSNTLVPDVVGGRAGTMAGARREDALRVVSDGLGEINDALFEVDTNPDAFGFKNVVGETAIQLNPLKSREEKERDAYSRASLSNIITRLRHDRYGGALTAGEAALAIEVFSRSTSQPWAIKQQLSVLKVGMARQKSSLEAQMGAQPTGKGGGRSGPPANVVGDFEAREAKRNP